MAEVMRQRAERYLEGKPKNGCLVARCTACGEGRIILRFPATYQDFWKASQKDKWECPNGCGMGDDAINIGGRWSRQGHVAEIETEVKHG